MEIVFASSNKHKIVEMNEIAAPYGVTFIAPNEAFDPVENGKTFEENAIIKAKAAAKLGGGDLFLSDDSGLCIDALNGGPGIHSARYAPTNEERIQKVLKNLDLHRNAHFKCVMALCDKNGNIMNITKGMCKGKIAHTPSGSGGFGYDPIFIPFGYDRTLAELGEAEKNKISHRGRALSDMLIWIKLNKFN